MPQAIQLNRFIPVAAFALATLPFAEAQSVVNVNVDPGKPLNILTTNLVGAWGNLGDGDLTSTDGMKLMKLGGISAVTYPTGYGDVADLYHWSTNRLTPNAGNADDVQKPYVQGKNDFASVALALSRYGITPVIHVNYGTNAAGNGGGEPAEAAAWVAYANAQATDGRVLGKDSAGFDWQTAGFWAKMRGEAPLATDDGYNFLRIQHPEPFHIQLWQVGDNIPENGYYGGDHTGGAVDLHAPYPPSKKDNAKRKKLPQLGPKTYADQLVAYSAAMKAVDPSILVGATLTLPVASLDDPSGAYAPDWNPTVLKTACRSIDFASYVWHPGNSSNDEQWKTMDDGILLGALTGTLPHILAESIAEDKSNCPAGKLLRLAFSQLSQLSWPKIEHPNVLSVFVADTYATLGEEGISNANWYQLRDGGLLDNGKPTPVYYGLQMAHLVAFRPGDQYVAASNALYLSVHATRRQEGVVGVMLINRDRHDAKKVKVNIAGGQNLNPAGVQFDYGPAQQATGAGPARSTATLDGASVSVTVPAYGIVDLLFKPK
jgi:alpha-L-arabinofuranosidase